jgi:ketosteroid isomerase-like protein
LDLGDVANRYDEFVANPIPEPGDRPPPMPDSPAHLEKIRRYLRSIETGDFACIAEVIGPNATIEQLPNRIYPNGIRAGVAKMADSFEKGRKLLSAQSYEIRNHVVNGDKAAVEVLWSGKLAIAFGNLAAGSEMRAHSAMFFEFAKGKIISQRNYDCFEPW